jgi:hypothetical protein
MVGYMELAGQFNKISLSNLIFMVLRQAFVLKLAFPGLASSM